MDFNKYVVENTEFSSLGYDHRWRAAHVEVVIVDNVDCTVPSPTSFMNKVKASSKGTYTVLRDVIAVLQK